MVTMAVEKINMNPITRSAFQTASLLWHCLKEGKRAFSRSIFAPA
jgi:hypothetical protein